VNILVATSEAVPLAKTGGLADVCGALPIELARLGHEVAVIMPAYRQVREAGLPIETTEVTFRIPIGRKEVPGRLLRTYLPSSHVPIYLVEQDDYYARDGLYQQNGEDYRDNCERFVFFSRAVMESVRLLGLKLDVLHANDWQTGLIPAYLKIEYRNTPGFERVVSLLTVHNLAYQGTFWHWDMLMTGLDWKYFNWHQMEFFGQLNLLKTGLVFADAINTVSPRYAEEIQSAPLGCGLEGVLQQRRNVLSGIINGVDYRQWNPELDPHLPVKYGAKNVQEGKASAKAALQAQVGLPQEPRSPLLAFVGRLADQKGVDLITSVLPDWAQNYDAQWVILGTGDQKYQEALSNLARRFSNRVAVRLEFSEPLAHLIEAGADMFLMPSQFEPCGLSQLYSLKYGTVPIVRSTGGLADTITDATDDALATGFANGFSFQPYSALSLHETVRRATNAYARPEIWSKLIQTGMAQDWSWARSAGQYVELYKRMVRAGQPEPAVGKA
jgi:starch synthase